MLDDDAISRYARQIVIPGFGASGQQKLLAATVLVIGDARGCDQAAVYLRAAGVAVILERPPSGEAVDVVVAAGADCLTEEDREVALAGGKPVCWYVARESGFTSGVHPSAPLPRPPFPPAPTGPLAAAVHDIAACDSAAQACAILAGLPWKAGPLTIDC